MTEIKAQDLRPGDRIGEWVLVDATVAYDPVPRLIIATWQRTDPLSLGTEVLRRWYEWDELVDVTARAGKKPPDNIRKPDGPVPPRDVPVVRHWMEPKDN